MIHLKELERALLNVYKVLLGNTLTPNTRISQELTQTETPRMQWNYVNRTGNQLFEELITGRNIVYEISM